jgi:AcrR family transcriptional regulator
LRSFVILPGHFYLFFFCLPRVSYLLFCYVVAMARPRTQSDEAILSATRATLRERGPAAPISAIAKRAGLSAPAILGRFGSRAALVQAALAPPSSALALAALHAEPRADAFDDQLLAALMALGQWSRQALPRLLLLRMSAPSQRPRGLSADHGPRLRPTLTIWLARAQARGLVVRGDPQALAATVLHTLQGHTLAPILEPAAAQVELRMLVAQLSRLLLAPAVRPRGDTARSS